MKKTKVFFLTLLFAAMATMPKSAMSQVTIGADSVPQDFSILELISNGQRGLRLPQLSTDEVRDLTHSPGFTTNTLANGLTVYNKTLNCVQYWNGTQWVYTCGNCGTPGLAYDLCAANDPTLIDLTVDFGGNVSWYNALTGGTRYDPNTSLISGTTYYADADCSTDNERIPVVVTLVSNCTTALEADAYQIFSPVSVMYTYQYQDLEAYKGVATGGNATSFQWYAKRKGQGGKGVEIPAANGGTAKTFRVPSHFPETAQTWSSNDLKTLLGNVNKNDTLIFTCEYTNPATSPATQTVTTEIEFIKLDENQFITIGGVKYYYVELDVPTSATSPNYSNSNGKLKILATNLGASDNAADFGDLYQWGRGGTADQTPDGHEHIEWGSKDSGTPILRTIAFATSTSGSEVATNPINPRDAGYNFIRGGDGYTWVNITNVVTTPTWSQTNLNNLWNGTATQTGFNPCPSGWHIPTSYEWGAIATGAPNFMGTPNNGVYTTAHNTWRFPSTNPIFGTNAHAGGVVVTADYEHSKSVFLPAAGYRYNGPGTPLNEVGTYGAYWSSTCTDPKVALCLTFTKNYVYAGYDYNNKVMGFSVRCVAEF
ncbi:MAG: fibrobacter succinogenes major paralogous domain-containing protein [Prevotellaceae bacterium]|jgi:uncharacterized protein (TIGR02145 family)|nr:fibrobacter succinogenes major paralogous domain-containing protein [Prevotellaceae bacterium]